MMQPALFDFLEPAPPIAWFDWSGVTTPVPDDLAVGLTFWMQVDRYWIRDYRLSWCQWQIVGRAEHDSYLIKCLDGSAPSQWIGGLFIRAHGVISEPPGKNRLAVAPHTNWKVSDGDYL